MSEAKSDIEYRIGDQGPAGGWIFYDKGSYSDGWRYLEAAPAETELKDAEWGPVEIEIGATMTECGSGKSNTKLFVKTMKQSDHADYHPLYHQHYAAQLCDLLNFNGFKDWFLPSAEELDLMYQNLAANGLGGFDCEQDYWYWSSSECPSDYSSESAYGQDFSDGTPGDYEKSLAYRIRAVRAF